MFYYMIGIYDSCNKDFYTFDIKNFIRSTFLFNDKYTSIQTA